MVTINSTARLASGKIANDSRHRQGWGRIGEIGFCALALWFVPIRRRDWRELIAAIVLFAGLTALTGCGGSGGSSSSSKPPVGTTAGNYTVTVTATTTATGVPVPAPLTIALTIN